MKRICIFPIFDADGIFDESLFFYLDSLSKVAQRVIVVVIGDITEESLKGLKKYTNEILVKDNRGFDAGAVKWCLKNHLSLEELNTYDELVLCNDTNFGPFVPFTEIFAQMERRDCDFWGINFIDTKLLRHIQSDFRVFKKRTFAFLYEYIMLNVNENENEKSNVVMGYEYCFYKKLVEAGFVASSWGRGSDVYLSPYKALVCGHPFLKVRGLSFYEKNKEQLDKAVEFTCLKYNYRAEWIASMGFRKYGVRISVPALAKNNDYAITEVAALDFFCANKKLYIYGTGWLARCIFCYYRENLQNLKGFVVTGSPEKKEFFSYPVFSLPQITDYDAALFLALNKKNTMQVLPLLAEYQNVVNLWEPIPASNPQSFVL